MVFDIAVANTEIENAKANKKPIPSKYYKQEDLQAKIDRSRDKSVNKD